MLLVNMAWETARIEETSKWIGAEKTIYHLFSKPICLWTLKSLRDQTRNQKIILQDPNALGTITKYQN